uniref:Uncharacterized protein n=1 Tax=Strongyloides venezuelensis TaxID=75913 RepID=A0A0K0F9T4_STRVS
MKSLKFLNLLLLENCLNERFLLNHLQFYTKLTPDNVLQNVFKRTRHFLSKNSSTGSNEENSPCNIKYCFSTFRLFLTSSIEGRIISGSSSIGSSSRHIFRSTLHPVKLFVFKSSIIDDVGILLSKFSNSKELFILPILTVDANN